MKSIDLGLIVGITVGIIASISYFSVVHLQFIKDFENAAINAGVAEYRLDSPNSTVGRFYFRGTNGLVKFP